MAKNNDEVRKLIDDGAFNTKRIEQEIEDMNKKQKEFI